MESTIGLYKTELVHHDRTRSWSGAAELERETASWVYWYNTNRIHHSIGKMSPVEFEDHHRLTNPGNDTTAVA
jgi:putative transposase